MGTWRRKLLDRIRISTLLEPLNMLSGSPASASLLLCRYTDLRGEAQVLTHPGPTTLSFSSPRKPPNVAQVWHGAQDTLLPSEKPQTPPPDPSTQPRGPRIHQRLPHELVAEIGFPDPQSMFLHALQGSQSFPDSHSPGVPACQAGAEFHGTS